MAMRVSKKQSPRANLVKSQKLSDKPRATSHKRLAEQVRSREALRGQIPGAVNGGLRVASKHAHEPKMMTLRKAGTVAVHQRKAIYRDEGGFRVRF